MGAGRVSGCAALVNGIHLAGPYTWQRTWTRPRLLITEAWWPSSWRPAEA